MDSPEPAHSNALEIVGDDPWMGLRRLTPARIALGRTGGSLRTSARLEFQLAHAKARDAVHAPFDVERLQQQLRAGGIETTSLTTAAVDRATYLLRPDLGRRLSEGAWELLKKEAVRWGKRDLVIIVSDGLTAKAAEMHAVATIEPLWRELTSEGWTIYPILVVSQARVKLQDQIGETLGAKLSLMLLGERPGLTASDSLGAYFTFRPKASCTDVDRNCVSNIRIGSLPPALAAQKISRLLKESLCREISGVALKESVSAITSGSGYIPMDGC